MYSKTSEPLLLLPALNIRRFKFTSQGSSLPIGLVVHTTFGLSLSALTACLLTGFVLTGCSNSPSHSARAETADKQSRPIASRGDEGSSVSSGGSIDGNSSGVAGVSADPDASVSSDNPGGIQGVSSGDSAGSSPGGGASAPYVGSGVVNGSTGASGLSDPDTVVSSGPLDDHHQWTQEEMLLARPMPETQEERDFVSRHKAAESIRTWTLGEFQDYTNSPMGRILMLQEGRRWVSIKATLKEQLALGQDFLAGGGKAKPKKAKSVEDSQSPEVIPEFLIDEGVFVGAECATTFDRLKECRQDITDLCRSIDGIKKTASKRGRLEALERYLNSQ
ncbi:MAG: hypothetical protein Q8T09_01155 [Candidatus Melainabacteria bacterium]|nr:hypothetical protein [Candidatus Melainabacteria bacterium]